MVFASSRRAFLAAAAAVPLASWGVLRAAEPDLSGLRDITGGAVPIGPDERARRLARAQALMVANGLGAVLIGDRFHMTAEGPRWFSTPPTSIDQPFG